MCPSIPEGTVSQTRQYKDSNTKNLLHISHTYPKRFGNRAYWAYAARLWNELPDNIKAADSVQNFKKQLKTLLF